MPTVRAPVGPTRQLGGNAQVAPLESTSTSSGRGLISIGAGLQDLGQATSAAANPLLERRAKREGLKNYVDTIGDASKINAELLGRSGEDAIGATNELGERLSGLVKNIEFKSSSARDEFNEWFVPWVGRHTEAMSRHEAREDLEAEKGLKVAVYDTEVESGALGWTSPDLLHESELKIREAAGTLSRGLSDAEIFDEANRVVSKMYSAAIKNAAAVSPEMAEELFNRIKSEVVDGKLKRGKLSAEDQAAAQLVVTNRKETRLGEGASRFYADQAVAGEISDTEARKGLRKALLDAGTSPEGIAQANTLFSSMLAEKRGDILRNQKLSDSQAAIESINIAKRIVAGNAQKGGLGVGPEEANEQAYGIRDEDTRVGVLKSIAQIFATGSEGPGDSVFRSRLRTFANRSPEDFRQLNLFRWKTELGDKFDVFVKMQETDERPTHYDAEMQRVAKGLKIDAGSAQEKTFFDSVEREIGEAEMLKNGRPLTLPEVRDIIAKQTKVDGFFNREWFFEAEALRDQEAPAVFEGTIFGQGTGDRAIFTASIGAAMREDFEGVGGDAQEFQHFQADMRAAGERVGEVEAFVLYETWIARDRPGGLSKRGLPGGGS